jgi:hypothetical protein
VHELEQVGFSEAMTIQRLLVDPQEQANLRDRVLIRGRSGNGLGPSDDGATAVHALPSRSPGFRAIDDTACHASVAYAETRWTSGRRGHRSHRAKDPLAPR